MTAAVNSEVVAAPKRLNVSYHRGNGHDSLTTHVCSADFSCIDDIECGTRDAVSDSIKAAEPFIKWLKDKMATLTRDVEAS